MKSVAKETEGKKQVSEVIVEIIRILVNDGSIFELSLTTPFPEDVNVGEPIKVSARFDRDTLNEFARHIDTILMDTSSDFFKEITGETL